jgi:hypothetical protein
MDINNLFLVASREKFRFPSTAGGLTVEDLWDLPLTSKGVCLDNIARALHREIKTTDEDVSFVRPATAATKKGDELQAKFNIVKYVIDTKLAEREASKVAEEKSALKQRLLALVAKKQDEALEGETVEQLEARIRAL